METGTHLGLGSCIIAAALLRNGHGRLTTIDVDADAGYLITEPWASVIDRRIGSSVDELASLRDVGMFLHDSLHTYDYETSELAAVGAEPATRRHRALRQRPRLIRTVRLGRTDRTSLPVLQGAAAQPLVAGRRHRGGVGKMMP